MVESGVSVWGKTAEVPPDPPLAAIEQIETLAREENISCDFERVDGFLFREPHGSEQLLHDEAEAARRIGLPCAWATGVPWPGFDAGPCLRFPRQAQFHPLKYL